jgi:hypothetical protein
VDNHPNEYHLITIDSGGTVGWAHFVFHCRAFSRPEHRLLRWLLSWDCGEFTGQEHDTLSECLDLIRSARFGNGPFVSKTDVVGEDFDLVQTIGGKNLLSPVRINAVLDWECPRQFGIQYKYQARQLRTSVTKERLRMWGFGTRLRRNEFAAMQHAIVYLRRLKKESRMRPWKLSDNTSANARWDCACEDGKRCDIRHSR